MERILRIAEVKRVIGDVSNATIWRWVKEGKFPKPIKFGDNSSGWVGSEVERFIEGRIQASRQESGRA